MSRDRDSVALALPAYEVGGEIARGAWGVVLEGRHRRLRREVAIKRLPPAFAADPEIRARFGREARLLALLDHPHIVPLYDYVEQDALCLLVMEKLTGGSVASRFAESGFPMSTACAIGLATSLALEYAHSRGILHRDVKPDNLLFSTDGALKMTDFGIAKVLGGSQTLATRAGDVLGTPNYMAPEQAAGQKLGPPTDVYATAVLVYELLSGQLPHPGDEDVFAMLSRRVHAEPTPLQDVRDDVPEPVARAVMRALSVSAADRPQTAQEFGVSLAAAATAAWGERWLSESEVAVAGGVIASAPAAAAPGAIRQVGVQAQSVESTPRVRAPGRASTRRPARVDVTPEDVVPIERVVSSGHLAAGKRLGRYVVEGVRGPWPLGSVYRARQDQPSERVGLKLLSPELAASSAVGRQFVLAGMRAARLNLPGVVPVVRAAEEGATPFVVIRLVDGSSLAGVLAERGRVGPRSTVAIVTAVAFALDAARELGHVHGQVCPDTVFLDMDKRAQLGDFAFSPELGSAVVGAAGSWPGPAAYAAPELLRGEPADHPADVYALARLAAHCLTGSPDGTLAGVPAAAQDVLAKGMAARPAQRYASGRAMARDLRAALPQRAARASAPCPVCGVAVASRRNRCASCDASLVWCASCATPGLASDRFCASCGGALA